MGQVNQLRCSYYNLPGEDMYVRGQRVGEHLGQQRGLLTLAIAAHQGHRLQVVLRDDIKKGYVRLG